MNNQENPTIIENGKETKVSTWGRNVVFNNGTFPTSITSQGQEILAAPIRVVGVSNDEEIIWKDEGCFCLADVKDQIIINGFAISQHIILNTSYVFEDSGMFRMDVKISPCGVTENQVFGVEERPDPTRTIQHIYLEFPIKKELNLYKFNRFSNNKVFDREGNPLFETGSIGKNGVRSGFEALTMLSNGKIGFSVGCESQKTGSSTTKTTRLKSRRQRKPIS